MFSDLSGQKPGPSLLCQPLFEDEGPVFERTSSTYHPGSERFSVGERSFSRQYAHIYAARLMQMKPLLSETAQQKWGKRARRSLAINITIKYMFTDLLRS